jgi:hypothetical protein
MQASLTTAGAQLATTLDGAVAQARTGIEATSRGLINALAQIEGHTKRQITTAADTTKLACAKPRPKGSGSCTARRPNSSPPPTPSWASTSR